MLTPDEQTILGRYHFWKTAPASKGWGETPEIMSCTNCHDEGCSNCGCGNGGCGCSG